ncbi:MAG: DUF116 domain-containing protein [archaeon]
MAYDFDFDLTKVSRSFFQKLAGFLDDKEIHRKMGNLAEDVSKKFKLEEITGVPFSDTAKVVSDLVDIHVRNLSQRKDFKETSKRALFLPHCSRKHMDDKCQANFNKELSSYECTHCSPDCLVNKATKIAEENGYDVYVLPGGSCIPKIIKNRDYEGIVGVACPNEIKMGEDYLDEIGIPHQAVPLLKNGCSDTKFNLETFERLLDTSRDEESKDSFVNPVDKSTA